MEKNLYKKDYYPWIDKTIFLLENHQFSELDLENLIEEIKSISISQQKALKSNLSVILWHLLKYLQEPEKQTRSWALNLFEHRERIEEDLENSPSLKSFLTEENFKKCYNKARKKAAIETGINLDKFPNDCPFTLAEALDFEFIPNQTI
ncbi:DUF29 domain-containing protein [Microcystis sp. LEGE 00066]|jgi:hypothetical protein|nr:MULTISPECIES: DUF29 domain-containing protein [Microcystis]TRU02736.1 MAG: DUF29 domain-containing protein [Microcystis aeruginosa Ma_AC_P_19900807_S300]ARI79683.1 hypothetical protein BH695_0402 [Microcystis aeruginosa PCC 7806SL]MBE9262464.1 DUF29 domain-containing protein [Microcystis sp. LEGE 00066]UGS08614.1 DUF29 domain-containing protein [Microcystis aeruginosa FACHB-905 = DIANCHI905]WKX63035.1 DUF29 domain-containing protein [Microcystis aeruginosa PCC 7806]